MYKGTFCTSNLSIQQLRNAFRLILGIFRINMYEIRL